MAVVSIDPRFLSCFKQLFVTFKELEYGPSYYQRTKMSSSQDKSCPWVKSNLNHLHIKGPSAREVQMKAIPLIIPRCKFFPSMSSAFWSFVPVETGIFHSRMSFHPSSWDWSEIISGLVHPAPKPCK